MQSDACTSRKCGYGKHRDVSAAPVGPLPCLLNDKSTAITATNAQKITLFSSYLGPVTLNVLQDEATKNYVLQGFIEVGSQSILTKVVDAVEYRLDAAAQYPFQALQNLRAKVVSPRENMIVYRLTLLVKLFMLPKNNPAQSKIQQFLKNAPDVSEAEVSSWLGRHFTAPEQQAILLLFRNDKSQLDSNNPMFDNIYTRLINENASVDCLFHMQRYLTWIYKEFRQIGVGTPNNTLLAVTGFSEDNAFFTGEYLVMCDGKNMFTNMSAADVVAHECSHALVQLLAGLEYQGESGANNEAFSDAFGAAYEFNMYLELNGDASVANDILGSADWKIGEDVGVHMPWLRNMENPEDAAMPQPKTYKGRYWYEGPEDFGGVHTNSGVMNYCFYRLATYMGVSPAIKLWFLTLKSLGAKASMQNVKDSLLQISKNLNASRDALIDAGLLVAEPEDRNRRQNTIPPPPPPQDDTKTPDFNLQYFLLPSFTEEMVLVPRSQLEKLINRKL